MGPWFTIKFQFWPSNGKKMCASLYILKPWFTLLHIYPMCMFMHFKKLIYAYLGKVGDPFQIYKSLWNKLEMTLNIEGDDSLLPTD